MKPNKMQQKVLDSKKRVVVITAQAGSGSSTALVLKLADEASKSNNNLAILLRRTTNQVHCATHLFLKLFPDARVSEGSGIITFKYNNKNVKIKFTTPDSLDLDSYLPLVAIDCASQFSNIPEIVNCSGKIIISDFMSNVEQKDSWAYKSNLLLDVDGKATWEPCVDHIVGFNRHNPGIGEDYLQCLDRVSADSYRKLMQTSFSHR